MTDGRFVVVEGPNGVGKTTCATLVAELVGHRTAVELTSEPSDTPLGRLVRSSESRLSGRALALAVAADRSHHLDTTILPAVARGDVVVCDRYVQSSLVLQRLDGLSLEEIWTYNAFAHPPDISFYLHDDAQVIGHRLRERSSRSRLEQAGSPLRELSLYDDAFDWLHALGWRQTRIDCQGKSPDEVAVEVLSHIDGLAI